MTTTATATDKKKKTAIDAPSYKGFWLMPEQLTIVGLDTADGQEHPLWDPRIKLPVDEELADDLIRNGVIQNVVVQVDGDRYLVVAGRQRVRSARFANAKLKKEKRDAEFVRIPVTVRKGTDESLISVALSENGQRRDSTPLIKAASIQHSLDRGLDFAAIGRSMKVSHQTVRNIVSLLDLRADIAKMVDSGEISESIGYELAKLPKDQQKAAFEEMQKAGKLTVTAAKVAAHNASNSDDGEGEEEEDDGDESKPKKPKKASKTDHKFIPPGLRPVKKVMKAIEEGTVDPDHFNEEVIKVFKWLMGDMSARAVKGLATALRVVGETADE